MKISIVTAVFNRVDTIAEAISSVQSQSHGSVEHVIQDGGSKDGTLDIIKGLETSTTRLVSEQDEGIYDAINRGISRATGDVIGLMHSDDFFAHERILKQIARAFDDPQVDGMYGDLDYVSASNPNKVVRRWRSGPFRKELLKKGWMPPHPTLYLRREVFERWGYYDTSYQIAADYEAMLRWLVRGQIKLAYIPEVLVKMRMGGESNRSLGRIIQKTREDYRAIRSNCVGGIGTLAMKNFSKITQFVVRNNQKK